MTAQLSPTPVQHFVDNNGFPLFFGTLGTFVAGTNTAQATYVDSTQTTQNTNPIVLNFRGECNLWLDPAKTYKFVLKDAFGNLIWTVDNIPGGPFTSGLIFSNLIPSPTNTLTLGNATNSWANLFLGPNASPVLGASGNIGYYTRTPAEIALSVTPTDYSYPADPYVDPRRYGADPTGVAVSTTAVQTALNVAHKALGCVWIGNACNFKCGALSVNFTGDYGTEGLRIMGSSVNGSMLTPTGSPSAFITITGPTPGTFPHGFPLVMENLTLNGSGFTSDAIVLQGLAFFTLRKIFAFGFNRAVFLNSALTGTIEDCFFLINNYGVYARQFPSAGSGNNMIKIRDCVIGSCARWGIDWGAGDRLKIHNCDMEQNGTVTAVTFTAPLGATAGTGTLTSNWALPTASYPMYFSTGEVRMASMTQGTTAVSWLPGLSSAETVNATVNTGAIMIRNTVNFGAGEAAIDVTGTWLEGNVGCTVAVESTSFLQLAFKDCVWYTDVNSMYVDGCFSITMEDCMANSVGAILNWRAAQCSFLKHVIAGSIQDNAVFPWWVNVTTAVANYPYGRPDSFSATLQGCTTTPSASITVFQQGDDITWIVPDLLATSNSTAASLTGIPAKYQPTGGIIFIPAIIENNAVDTVQQCLLQVASGTLILYQGGSQTGFTAAGSKGVRRQNLKYRLNS